MQTFVDKELLDEEEYESKRKALRDSVICVGWVRLISVVYYVMLYFLIHANSKGHMSDVLQTMTLVPIIPQVFQGVLLFFGALEAKVLALELSLWLCLLVATYNCVLGVMGGIYFIRHGYLTMHFLLAVLYGILALSLYAVVCHDFVLIYSFKSMIYDDNVYDMNLQK